MTLTIYSEDYDERDAVSDGMSGAVFLDPCGGEGDGIHFGKRLSDAMTYIANNRVKVDDVVFCYRDGKCGQMFMRFNVFG